MPQTALGRRLKKIKKLARLLKKEWAKFSSDLLTYCKDWALSRLARISFWYNRSRKIFVTIKELKLLGTFTDWIENRATHFTEFFIQLFVKYPDGQLAKIIDEATIAFNKKKEEIKNQPHKSLEEIQKELAQWESGLKESPLTLLFKLVSSIFDLVENATLLKKAVNKAVEIDARIQLQFTQTRFFNTYENHFELDQEKENNFYVDYKAAYEKVIKTARDPILAQAFLEAYIVILRKLRVQECEVQEIYLNLKKDTQYEKKLTEIKNTQAIEIYDVNLKILKKRHERIKNKFRDERVLDTPYNRITNMVEQKESATVLTYALAILNENPLFSDLKNNKAQLNWFSPEWKIHRDRFLKENYELKQNLASPNYHYPQDESNKKRKKFLEKKHAYFHSRNEKIARLCDLSQVSNLENSEAKFSKLMTVATAIILILDALLSLASFVFSVVALATTGNVGPVFKSASNLLNAIKNFAGDKALTFVDIALPHTAGLLRTTRKWRNARATYIENYKALDQELGRIIDDEQNLTVLERILKQKAEWVKAKAEFKKDKEAHDPNNGFVGWKRDRFLEKREQYYASIGKRLGQEFAENTVLEKLKIIRANKRRFDHLNLKIVKKIIPMSNSFLMFSTSILTVFIPTGPFAIIAGIISFVLYPIVRRLASPEGQKEIQEEAIALNLLPKNLEPFKSKSFALWVYVTFSFLFKFTIEGVIKSLIILPIMRLINQIIKSNHNEGIEDVIQRAEKALAFSFLIAEEIKNEAEKLNLIDPDGSVVKNKAGLLFLYAPISLIFKIPEFTLKLILVGVMKLFRCKRVIIGAVNEIFSYSLVYGFCYLFKKMGDWLTEPRGDIGESGIEILKEESYHQVSQYLLKNSNLEIQFIQKEGQLFCPKIMNILDVNPEIFQKKEGEEFAFEGDQQLHGKIKLGSLTTEYRDNATYYYGFFNLEIRKLGYDGGQVNVFKVPFNKIVELEIML